MESPSLKWLVVLYYMTELWIIGTKASGTGKAHAYAVYFCAVVEMYIHKIQFNRRRSTTEINNTEINVRNKGL